MHKSTNFFKNKFWQRKGWEEYYRFQDGLHEDWTFQHNTSIKTKQIKIPFLRSLFLKYRLSKNVLYELAQYR